MFGGVLSSLFLHNGELYRRTAEDLLLKYLDDDQARVAMREVHEGVCCTHQSAPKMKWHWEIHTCRRHWKMNVSLERLTEGI